MTNKKTSILKNFSTKELIEEIANRDDVFIPQFYLLEHIKEIFDDVDEQDFFDYLTSVGESAFYDDCERVLYDLKESYDEDKESGEWSNDVNESFEKNLKEIQDLHNELQINKY